MRRTRIFELKNMAAAAVIGMAAFAGDSAMAQVAPTASEAAAYTGLHDAAHQGNVAKIEQLAASKADLNTRDSNGRTQLHVASFAEQRDAIRALVKAGANLQLTDRQGNTPLQLATPRGYTEMVEMLSATAPASK